MKHTKLKIIKMVDELLNYLFYIDIVNINVNIREESEYYEIDLIGTFKHEPDRTKIEIIADALSIPRREEIEEYYWELMGESDVDSELEIIGMMCRTAEVELLSGSRLKIHLIRDK